MDEIKVDRFWRFIAEARDCSNTKEQMANALVVELARGPVRDVIDFQLTLDDVLSRIDNWDLYGAYYNLFDIGSHDRYQGFLLWIVSLGREVCDLVLSDADNLIAVPELLQALHDYYSWMPDQPIPEQPEFASLGQVAGKAFMIVTGDDSDAFIAFMDSVASDVAVSPRGECWDFDDWTEVRRCLPKIAAHISAHRPH